MLFRFGVDIRGIPGWVSAATGFASLWDTLTFWVTLPREEDLAAAPFLSVTGVGHPVGCQGRCWGWWEVWLLWWPHSWPQALILAVCRRPRWSVVGVSQACSTRWGSWGSWALSRPMVPDRVLQQVCHSVLQVRRDLGPKRGDLLSYSLQRGHPAGEGWGSGWWAGSDWVFVILVV